MSHQEFEQRLSDYALGLLPSEQETAVAAHLTQCADCRETVYRDREMGMLVRKTLRAATRPNSARLQRLMPAIPQKRNPRRIPVTWTGRLAPALVAVLLIVGGLLLWMPDSEQPAPLFIVVTATATSTNTPTATIAQEAAENAMQAQDAAEKSLVKAAAVESPAPQPTAAAPTPVAAVDHMATNRDL